MRRVLGLHANLSAAARQCEAAHCRSVLGLVEAQGIPAISTASVHSTAGQALRLAASTLAAGPSSWKGCRTFAAQAAPSADPDSVWDLTFTETAVEVSAPTSCVVHVACASIRNDLPATVFAACSSDAQASCRWYVAEAGRAGSGDARPAAGAAADGGGRRLLRLHLLVRPGHSTNGGRQVSRCMLLSPRTSTANAPGEDLHTSGFSSLVADVFICTHCRTVTQGPATLVCDPVSYEFVRGSTIDYTTDLIRSAFEVRLIGLNAGHTHTAAWMYAAKTLFGQSASVSD